MAGSLGLVAAGAWLVAMGLTAAASAPLGMVLQVSGEIWVERGGENAPLQMADLLYPGDTVTVEAGEAVLVFCPSQERLALKEGAVVRLEEGELTVVKGPEPARTAVRTCSLPRVALGAESLERVGALRARGYAPIPLYLGGPVSTDRPVFEWGPIEGAESYLLTLRNEQGKVLWETRSTGLRERYPNSLPALEEKTYQWELRAERGGEILAQQLARIEIRMPREPLEEPAPGDLEGPESILLRIVELQNAGYYSEAAAGIRVLRENNPKDERLTRHLIWLYWNSGLIVAANEERLRLETSPQD